MSAYDWDELDEVEAQRKRFETEQFNKAQGYKRLFVDNPDGQKFVEEQMQLVTMSIPGPNASEREVGMADGRRLLMKEIFDQIALASGGKHE